MQSPSGSDSSPATAAVVNGLSEAKTTGGCAVGAEGKRVSDFNCIMRNL
jgi:hypothetical protein